MHNSNLVELLKKLTIKEIKGFILYLEGPLLSKGRYRKETLILIKMLAKHAPDFEDPLIGKTSVYKQVFVGEEFKEGRLEKVMVELFKSLRLFLLTEQYLQEENEQNLQIDFARILSQRGLPQKAANLLKLVQEELQGAPSLQEKDYERLHKASELSYALSAQKNKWKDDLNIAQTLRHLDLYYFSKRLNLLNHYLVILKMSRVAADIDLEKELLISGLFQVSPDESPIIYVAQKIFQLYSSNEPSTSAFEELLQILTQFESLADADSLQHYFYYLRNYCSFLILNGHNDLWPILHRINRDNLHKNYFYYQGSLSPGAILSISNTAIRANDVVWAEAFIETHKHRILGDNETMDFYQTVLANLLFYKGAYEKTLETLPAASQHVDFHLYGRRVELKAYFELKSDLLYYKIDAFKMYLSRASKKTLSDETSEMNSNFINFLHQIVYSKPGDPNRGETIIKRIKEKKLLIERDWLIEKAQELT